MALTGGADSGGINLEQIAPFDASRLLRQRWPDETRGMAEDAG